MRVLNIAFYRFQNLKDLQPLKALLYARCSQLELRGSILISPEGVNGCLAGLETQIREFQSFFATLEIGKAMKYRESYSDAIPFRKLFVKMKREIIPMDDPSIQPAEGSGAYISPQELKRRLDENWQVTLLDTRNQYEVALGTFHNAQHFELKNFRELPKYLQALPEEYKAKPLVMFCTGGIRCEKASIVAMQMGFKEVFQLEGGILRYFETCGGAHYDGDCFVFDERVALDCHLRQNTGVTNEAVDQGRRVLGP
jgi:UPF0176 protein